MSGSCHGELCQPPNLIALLKPRIVRGLVDVHLTGAEAERGAVVVVALDLRWFDEAVSVHEAVSASVEVVVGDVLRFSPKARYR